MSPRIEYWPTSEGTHVVFIEPAVTVRRVAVVKAPASAVEARVALVARNTGCPLPAAVDALEAAAWAPVSAIAAVRAARLQGARHA